MYTKCSCSLLVFEKFRKDWKTSNTHYSSSVISDYFIDRYISAVIKAFAEDQRCEVNTLYRGVARIFQRGGGGGGGITLHHTQGTYTVHCRCSVLKVEYVTLITKH